MKNLFLILTFFMLIHSVYSQDNNSEIKDNLNSRFISGINIGISGSYTDKAFLFCPNGALVFDIHIKKGYYLQFAPKYTWLYRWNEHYITIPLHVKKRVSQKVSLFAGPAMTWDVGYFRDLGVSAGAIFHIGERSSINLSAFTFTLYDYKIDYLYVPIGISYQYIFLKK